MCSNSHGSLWHSHVEPVQHNVGHLFGAIMFESSPHTHCLLSPTSDCWLLRLKMTPSFRQIQSLNNFHFYRHGYCNREVSDTYATGMYYLHGHFAKLPPFYLPLFLLPWNSTHATASCTHTRCETKVPGLRQSLQSSPFRSSYTGLSVSSTVVSCLDFKICDAVQYPRRFNLNLRDIFDYLPL